MAKRTNILRIIGEEIKKGNIYIAANGNFVSEVMLNDTILGLFKSGLDNKTVDITVSFADFKSEKLKEYTTAQAVYDNLCERYHMCYEASEKPEQKPDEKPEQKPDEKQEQKPEMKGGKKK